MSAGWHVDLRPDGIFEVKTEVGKPMFDGAFRPDMPDGLRFSILTKVAEAPAMLSVLMVVLSELSALAAGLIEQQGGGAVGQVSARKDSPRLFELIDLVKAQVATANGEES